MERRRSVQRMTQKLQRRVPSLKNALSFKVRRRAAVPEEQDERRERRRSEKFVPRDVRECHLAVYAAEEGCRPRRFVIPVDYLKHPVFKDLLRLAEEEFGFDYHPGALTIPCEPLRLEEIINSMEDSQLQRGAATTTANSARFNLWTSRMSSRRSCLTPHLTVTVN